MDASCGPSNALSNLNKHAQNDRTLQNEAGRFGTPGVANSFKQHSMGQIDRGLNGEFEQFRGTGFSQDFGPQTGHPGFQNHQHSRFSPQVPDQTSQMGPGGANGQWMQDFSKMSLAGHPNQSSAIQKNNWQAQFMQHRQAQQSQQSQQHQNLQHQQSLGQFQHQFQPQSAQYTLFRGPQETYQGFHQPQFINNQGMATKTYQEAQMDAAMPPATEHQEIHKMEQENARFEDHFDQVERELREMELEQQEVSNLEKEAHNEEFAKTARQVHDLMLNTKSDDLRDKFQGSDFMKLMQSIANRDVELQGDSLVEKSSGNDIRNHLADPLREQRDVNALPSAVSQETVTHEPESERVASHLPDPLAHIKAGGLENINDALTAAKIASGGQVTDGHWFNQTPGEDDWLDLTEDPKKGVIMDAADQEIYDDYRNHDTL